MLSRLVIAALRSPIGKGLTSWILLVILLHFCYFPMWYPGSDVVLDFTCPGRCRLSYFAKNFVCFI